MNFVEYALDILEIFRFFIGYEYKKNVLNITNLIIFGIHKIYHKI